ncbi:MAG: hypothetical protein GC131_09495 [Alphaproteobacteria bacterium]|nr:hypothetical protein [Alphaproteobacteria bacterium]
MNASVRKPLSKDEIADICAGDCCSGAVRRAYSEMLDSGAPDGRAYEAALAVFGWYHPEVAAQQAHAIVSQWVRPQVTH